MRAWLGSTALLFSAACNVTTVGDRGVLTFTPDDCGVLVCALDDDLASGASLELTVGGALASDVVVAEDPGIATVFPIGSRWQVVAVAPGRTGLVVVDRGGFHVDRTDLRVARTDRLGLAVRHGAAYGTTSVAGGVAQESWRIGAGQPVELQARPYDASDRELMGKLSLSAEIDRPLLDALQPSARLEDGEVDLRPMRAGDYGLVFTGADGLVLDVQIAVR